VYYIKVAPLLGVYLADRKVNEQIDVKKMAGEIIRSCSGSLFFLWNALIMTRIRHQFKLQRVIPIDLPLKTF